MLANIEAGGERVMRFSIGSAATRVAIQVLGSGAHVLSANNMYLKRIASDVEGLEVTPFDLENMDEEVSANTKLIWFESLTDPTLKLMDEVMYPEDGKRYDLAWGAPVRSAHGRRWIEDDVLLFSGTMSFELPTHAYALALLISPRLFGLAESIVEAETLPEHPASMTHECIPKEERLWGSRADSSG
ncbi:hypothetical protein EST38_g7930 [Candolleomyces aberdarensis]|uniref:cystathionine gamma-lyase n=1 Tax=Candolleomyces aberdarensis TaxID=2316362 RepID=A0A4Q2DGQ3_9AGAR|nr:hypothetical protein EST38_g7930 [Candolleomyces aberdarensis]